MDVTAMLTATATNAQRHVAN